MKTGNFFASLAAIALCGMAGGLLIGGIAALFYGLLMLILDLNSFNWEIIGIFTLLAGIVSGYSYYRLDRKARAWQKR